MSKEQEKLDFLNNTSFTEEDWIFFDKYPKLFTICRIINHYELDVVDSWFEKFKEDYDKDLIETIIYTIYNIIEISKSDEDVELKNKYSNFAKYDFKEFVNDIEFYSKVEKFPVRIRYYLDTYLKK